MKKKKILKERIKYYVVSEMIRKKWEILVRKSILKSY